MDFKLGLWVTNQRRLKAEIPVERRHRLDTLGFIWDVNEADWEEGLSQLKNYKTRETHCRVPQKYTADGFRLGLWVAVQRRERDIWLSSVDVNWMSLASSGMWMKRVGKRDTAI